MKSFIQNKNPKIGAFPQSTFLSTSIPPLNFDNKILKTIFFNKWKIKTLIEWLFSIS